MAHVRLVDLPETDGPLRTLFETYTERFGFLPNVLRLYGVRPKQAVSFFSPDGFYREVMFGESGLTPAEREMIAVAVSVTNGCAYCTASHSAYLRQKSGDPALADAVRADWRSAPLTERQQAMLAYAVKLTVEPKGVGAADVAALRAHGFSEADIVDITQVAATFNYTNRVLSALDVEPNPEFEQVGR